MTERDKQQIKTLCRGVVLEDTELKNFTSFIVGGPADIVAYPEDRDDLVALVQYVRDQKIPVFVLGEGTNVIVRDNGFRGVVIKLSQGFTVITVEREKDNVVEVKAQAGARWMRLVAFALNQGLSGLEFGSGIPGSVGGAVAMNAGAFGKEVKDVLRSLTAVSPEGSVKKIERETIPFDYRTAGLPAETVVLDAVFALTRDIKEAITAAMNDNLTQRRKRQPLDLPSAGSVFRNPPGLFAAKLIEEAGLKGCHIGGAAVSRRHANFIVNRGGATADNIIALMTLIQEKVEKETGVTLEPEIRIIGEA